MADFIEDYCIHLQSLQAPDDLSSLYAWFYAQQTLLAEAIRQINERLELSGTKYQFQSDLPCISVGPGSQTLILAANPGWSEDSNKRENDYCTASLANYENFISHFHAVYPEIIGHRNRWWTRVKNFARDVLSSNPDDVGAWELIPFHSKAHRGPEIFADYQIQRIAIESVHAALRMNPKMLVVASKEGAILVRSLLTNHDWHTAKIGGRNTFVKRTMHGATEVILLGFQLVRTRFKDQHLKTAIERLRRSF